MTETTKLIFEKYQIRKTKKQKTDFIEFVKDFSAKNGYNCNVEKGYCGARNIVIGNPETAKVVYTAHYDTCAVLPFPNFITPKNFGIYLLYNLALVLGIIVVMFAIGFAAGFIIGMALGLGAEWFNLPDNVFDIIGDNLLRLSYIALLLLVFAGPANKHTANDNTSGVTALLDLMAAMPLEQREKAAFIFFDLEEAGMFGSSGYAAKHKNVKKQKLIINFDCVSDGDNFIFAVSKRAKDYAPMLETAYKSDKFNVEVLTKNVFYPSDQANFKQGVGVASLKKSKRFGFLYMDRIHTKKDVIYQEENIEFLVNASVEFTNMI